ncbi:hypothetical protein PybrP1_003574 [[Pythium] brassicae (nom. inval.)]|nr:hypothetical protein PybrP1_003574 [[Pythium] brassicae (nom. inval.)]
MKSKTLEEDGAAACGDDQDHEPDMEDLVRLSLLLWYDAHRRRLPWRGDAPPFISTASHTKARPPQASNPAKSGTLLSFFKREAVDECEQPATGTGDEADEAAVTLKEERVEVDADGGVRDVPPRTVSPYETWVSEIMLQQTRVDTVVDYFLRWTDKFPTVAALASGSEQEVNALWAGLGYYRRARMLHAGAKYVVENFGGELPGTVEQLLTIPGIGPYTAGAISSIAFGNREPLVDGNVIRVLARLRAVGADPKNKELIKFSWECERPGELNQALMELGATVCTVQSQTRKKKGAGDAISKAEQCTICDASRFDEWSETHSEVTKYPLKAKKGDSKNEVICVSVVSCCDDDTSLPAPSSSSSEPKARKAAAKKDTVPANWSFLMTKRPDEGLLAGQWEFIHKKVDDGDKVPAFTQRKKLMDVRLSEILGKGAIPSSSGSSSLLQHRRDLGELTHIFSHVKHHMGVEHLHFASKPNVMQQLGITTGVKKILGLVAKAAVSGSELEAASSSATKRRGATSSQAKKKVAGSAMGGDAPHAIALQVDAPLTQPPDTVVYFRKLVAADIEQVRGLHETWFPIRYNQSFYDGAATGLWMETGGPLFAQLAVQVPVAQGGIYAGDYTGGYADGYAGSGREYILGAVTASTLPLAKIEDPELLAADDVLHTHVMYILTLGCRSSVRRRGIASALLQECIDQAGRQPQCGAVYLHVKADNVTALRFYEKNGFQNLRFLEDYYVIDGVRHDAYLYIRYVNGAGPQKGWLELLARPLRAFFTLASSGWRKLLDGLSNDDDDGDDKARDRERGGAQPTGVEVELGALLVAIYFHEAPLLDTRRHLPTYLCEVSDNDIDDLLGLIGDECNEPAAVHPRSGTTYAKAASSTSTDAFQCGGKKKCSQLLLNGEHAKRGVNTALSSQSGCSNLRCNECDFTVVQFFGKKWNASADYMFFRENVPNEAKLRAKMDSAPGVVAYACQCKWLSIDVQTRADSCRVKWACAGH